MYFKPKLIPTLFTVPALIALFALGTWQLQRLDWKNSLVQQIEAKSLMPSIALNERQIDLPEDQYRNARLTGKFLNEHEIHLYTGPKYFKGKPGYDILTPFKTEDGDIFIVNRGWVRYAFKEQDTRPESLIEGEVTIEGMIHRGEERKKFIPENDHDKNLWFWIDLDSIYKKIDLPNIGYYIRQLKNNDSEIVEYPIAGERKIKQKNDHLQYAITWYSLAIILLVIYFLFHTKKIDSKNGKI